MDKNKILAAARIEKHRGKEFENKETTRSSLLSGSIAMLLSVALFLLEYFIKDSVNVSLIAVGMTQASISSIYEGIKLRRHYMSVIGIFYALIAVVAIFIFIGQVVSK